jgi:hypothetical protein
MIHISKYSSPMNPLYPVMVTMITRGPIFQKTFHGTCPIIHKVNNVLLYFLRFCITVPRFLFQGSCQGESCENLSYSTLIPELGNNANSGSPAVTEVAEIGRADVVGGHQLVSLADCLLFQ